MEGWRPNPSSESPNFNERRRQSTIKSDIMTEHSAPGGSKPSGNDAFVDPDTCRICRGEGTAEEPLFYPCKCSGSIKYVHQDCLMEWLSHSQKKHCELCKTPFRFTKLYSPDMPKRLPFYIFITHMAKYVFRNLLVWLRAALVISVWLGWLPYLMRWVWSGLFWVSDEGFGSSLPNFDGRNTSVGRDGLSSLTVTFSTTCASSPLLAATTTAASVGRVIEQVPVSNLLKVISKPLVGAPPSWLAALFGLSTATEKSIPEPKEFLNVTRVDQIASSLNLHPRSLLSDVTVLKNLTRHPAINRTIIAVFEGQIITLLVIVCFILIILVRDYVVQQQPEINMRAAFAAAENEGLPAEAVNDGAPHNLGLEDDSDDASDDESIVARGGSADAENDEQDTTIQTDSTQDVHSPQNLRSRPIAEPRRRMDRSRPSSIVHDPEGEGQTEGTESAPSRQSFANEPSVNSPGAEEAGRSGSSIDDNEATSQSAVKEYLRIYREADGDHERILRIIRNEGLEDRMGYWIQVTKTMASVSGNLGSSDNADLRGDALANLTTTPHISRLSRSPMRSGSLAVDRTSSDASSWTWADADDVADAESQGSRGKGKAPEASAKGNVWTHWDGEFGEPPRQLDSISAENHNEDPSPFSPALTRSRAVSDGPQAPKPINILANNNWSFPDRPPDAANTPQEEASEALGEGEDIPYTRPTLHGEFDARETWLPAPDSNTPDSSAIQRRDRPGAEERPDNNGNERRDEEGRYAVDTAAGVEQTHNQHAAPAARHAGGIVGRVADFMWGNVEVGPLDDLDPDGPVDIFGENHNAPFFGDDDREDEGDDEGEAEVAPDVVEAAVAAGLDPEAVEDAEDFEGIMELIGMRGPVAGLFQNAIFCAFLVSISIFLGVFVPYNVGRVSVWIIANPARLLRIVFSFSKFVQDGVLLIVGYTSTIAFNILEVFRLILGVERGQNLMHSLRTDAKHVAASAFDRIVASFVTEMPLISMSEMRNFSAVSHEALLFVKNDIQYALSVLSYAISYLFGGSYSAKLAATKAFFAVAGPAALGFLKSMPSIATHPGSWILNLSSLESSSSANPVLAYWDANDRTWAILLGYVSLSVIAGLYLARGTPFSTGQTAQEWEASIIDALNQASGVMKVILIISIEMLIFPLYCGLLLDLALLPLFEGTSVRSRLLFTYNYPLTSIFVHWFVGTGYMFHFALFVSMCRKIMRKGVLYFIRDPDDPEFHPVRDVLERNVMTQLRKILFSAFVYGALVVVCLGGVVWGLSLALPNVLPIHYSSNEPVLEFPIDLLFYNFLMPLAVRFFKPSDGLHSMYTWWFRRCARALRLTWFLFGERRVDEEGILELSKDSPHRNMPWWCRVFLEVNGENQVVPKMWQDTFNGGNARPNARISTEDMNSHNDKKKRLVESRQLIPNGRFVRSPASDQVKIPKGQSVFLDVSEQNDRSDGKPDRADTDLYAGAHYQLVYVPPWFRARVFLFILFIWIFAAVTGVGFTIVPLVFGRRMFKVLIPSHIRTNDIYAFSIGIYILGSLGYLAFHSRAMLGRLRSWTMGTVESTLDRRTIQRTIQFVAHVCRLLYTYIALLVVFPLLITLLVELYLLVPVHTYMYSAGTDATRRLDVLRGGHTIRVIQAWTLGILYLKLGSRALVLYGGRPAHAVRAVLRRGWLEPDVGILTRAFVIPGVFASLVMIFTPPLMAWTVLRRGLDAGAEVNHEMRVLVYRLAYPLTALFWAGLLMARSIIRVFEGWQVRIRDEAYLMGERLHNFGGTAAKASGWRGGTRL
ncbi:hypothetical protein GGS23DRAFT_566357 [Durotheca rogersii]|uniref:uncharacterized protein n=1 Tax=Durotheca rogersii TaxID=419775 RepID=UPI0022203275|nr:uncharacterized protein GGS23DRAFT_566357 [Durotheca rogersii]KAI5863310.1 hypothetical protein GGS23DRAFT_566357 [Durotheca rogersii]